MKQLLSLLLVLLLALPVTGYAGDLKPAKRVSCKEKIAAKKKEIRKKVRTKAVPYYARVGRYKNSNR